MLVSDPAASIPIATTRTACKPPTPIATPNILQQDHQAPEMPLESLQDLQDLEITVTEGSQQHETQYEPIENDEQPAHHPFRPDQASAPHQGSQAHSFEQPHITPFYPPLSSSFGFDSTIPIDPGLLDARFGHDGPPGPDRRGVPGLHQGPWAARPATSVNMDSFMVSPTSLPQYSPPVQLVPGMSSFEPMVSTTWSMDGSSTSTSTSRGPAMSSSLSVPSTSTPASSQSPGSPRKVESRTEDQLNKKSRQASGPKAPPTTSAGTRSHRNNSAPGFLTTQVSIAPAIGALATTSDDQRNSNRKNDNEGSSSSRHRKKSSATTAATTSNVPPGPARPGPTPQPTILPAPPRQQEEAAQPQQPDSRARNREAANRCRAKSKVAVAELEATERAMGAEHQELTRTARSLREEVLSLKNTLLLHGNCDDDLIQQYLVNSARMVGRAALGPVVAAATTTTTTADATTAGAGGSSSRAMLPSPPPGMLPSVLPSSSAPGAGTRPARGHQKGGSARR